MNYDLIRLKVLELLDALSNVGGVTHEELEWVRSRRLDVQQWDLTLKRFKAEGMEKRGSR